MKIFVDRSQMLKAVSMAKNFAEASSGQKVLQSAFLSAGFGRVRLTTTDLTLWCQVDFDAQTPKPGTAVVPVRTMGTILKTLPHSHASLHKEGDEVCFAAGSSEVRLAGADAEEYPDINPPEGRLAAIPLPAALVNRVAYAVSKDARDTLGGVFTEVGTAGLKLVATDRHRLARYQAASLPPGSVLDTDLEEPISGIVPVRLLSEGVRLGSQLDNTATLELYEKAACIKANGSVMLWADLIEGQYPDYEGVVPSAYSGCVTMPRGVLGDAVSRLLALSKGYQSWRIRLAVEDGEMVLKVEHAVAGLSAVARLAPCAIEGTVPACGFNVRYLSEALDRLPGTGRVQLKFSDDKGESPVAIESSECKGISALIMPMRL